MIATGEFLIYNNARGDFMLTYDLNAQDLPLYEALYRSIRRDILRGTLKAGEKLPSKRALAGHLHISKVTVETAYAQLTAEGYLRPVEKVGYFVESVDQSPPPGAPAPRMAAPEAPAPCRADFTVNTIRGEDFPFDLWARLLRGVIADYHGALLDPLPNGGALALRQAIADYLQGFRGMAVSPEQIIVGAGTDFLYNLLVQLLGRDLGYGVEDPGYGKILRVYQASGVRCIPIPMDEEGILLSRLRGADVLHICPAHHFPTGVVMPIRRRQALLEWAGQGDRRYIIEDDYDSEFRFTGRPIPPMQSMDRAGKVIYINSFSKSISPAIRISYMILPPALLARFREKLGFYACTVPSFEQYTLARFIGEGHFEKHLARMKKRYRSQRNALICQLEAGNFGDRLRILEKDAGLHFLLEVKTELDDRQLTQALLDRGLRVSCLSAYYHGDGPRPRSLIVINYTGTTPAQGELLAEALGEVL